MSLSFKEFEQEGWEKVADAYHEGFGQITPKAALALVNSASVKQNDKVLDIACGPGYVAAFAFAKGAVVTGIDFSNAMIQKAKILHPKINFQVMDAEELQFDDASFDVILMNFGILHFVKPEQAITEAFRVLKPGGKFLYTVWDRPERSKAFDLIMSVLNEEGDINISLPEGPDFYKFSDPHIAKEILSTIGFKTIEAAQIEFTWTLDSSEELFQTFYKGGIRIGGMLRAQKPETISKMMETLKLKTKAFQRKGKLEIPTSVMLFKAQKV
ncbi:MAG: class I SAM-dependent methyltransferase [Chlamydiae bacterium]|nr:class I SAM-dependent methyltransferase [Chlamydiota bacterium]